MKRNVAPILCCLGGRPSQMRLVAHLDYMMCKTIFLFYKSSPTFSFATTTKIFIMAIVFMERIAWVRIVVVINGESMLPVACTVIVEVDHHVPSFSFIFPHLHYLSKANWKQPFQGITKTLCLVKRLFLINSDVLNRTTNRLIGIFLKLISFSRLN